MKKPLLAALLTVAALAASSEAMAYVSVGISVGGPAYVAPVYAPVTPMTTYVAPYTATSVATTTVVAAPGTVVYTDPYAAYGAPVAVAPVAGVVIGGGYHYGYRYGGYRYGGYRYGYGRWH